MQCELEHTEHQVKIGQYKNYSITLSYNFENIGTGSSTEGNQNRITNSIFT